MDFMGKNSLAHLVEKIYGVFAQIEHSHSKSDIRDLPEIPTKVSDLVNDSGFKTTDNNTTYTLTKDGETIVLTGSDGSAMSVKDSDTKITVDSELCSNSTNPVQNKVLNEEFEAISEAMTIMEDAVDSKLNASDYKIDNGFSITSINPISNYAITARFEDLNREMPRDYVFVVYGDGVVDVDLIKAQNTIDNGGFIYCNYEGIMLPLVTYDENAAVFTTTATEERMVSAFTVVINLNTLEAECSITQVTADMVDASPLGHGHSASEIGAVPTSRTINGKELSSDIRLSASDVGALPSTTTIPSIEGLATETYVDEALTQKSQVQIITWEDDD